MFLNFFSQQKNVKLGEENTKNMWNYGEMQFFSINVAFPLYIDHLLTIF